ncbi:flagellar protein FliL [Janthinobacterium sp. CG_23.3]|uniref:flagellar basal body-associated FliL family protein n=1 Tax=unclassified Janthinobacterium TaxID=2610881 RepID=UPI00034859C4|nr:MULTISPECIES: flagellar basal body-associated FliL family protein [unclassified Janthinobacterium]MEC5160627.1 flagellar FliL protein [Janthinobacterium sp. CG_S6]
MKKNLKLIVGFVLVAVIGAGAAGGALWWLYLKKPAHSAPSARADAHAEEAEPQPATGKHARKYLTLEKVIVMLRRNPGDVESHYLSADLVITTTVEQEKQAKDHLPLMRSIAVKALASYPMEKAQAMTVEQFAEQINTAFDASYAKEKAEKPFSEAMIGKLIIE